MLISIFLIIIGIFVAIKPYIGWYILIGWQIKDSEPTHFALLIYRIVALINVFIGFIVIIRGSY